MAQSSKRERTPLKDLNGMKRKLQLIDDLNGIKRKFQLMDEIMTEVEGQDAQVKKSKRNINMKECSEIQEGEWTSPYWSLKNQ